MISEGKCCYIYVADLEVEVEVVEEGGGEEGRGEVSVTDTTP